jgi:hypothetical protein
MKWQIKFCLPLVFLIVIIGAITPIPGQCFFYDSFLQHKGNQYVYMVTVSENPNANAMLKKLIFYPYAQAVGDQIRIQIQKANTTKLSGIKYDTVYGGVQMGSFNSSVWFNIAPANTLLGAYNRTVGWLVNPWSPFIIPRNDTWVNQTMCQMLQTSWNFTSIDWNSEMYCGEWSGWNGPYDGGLNQTKMSLKFSFYGMLEYWRIYNGTDHAWNLIFNLELLTDTLIPQADEEYVWKVTVSENPKVNPIAPNVGDQMKIKVLINNYTFTPPLVYQTIYGQVFNCSATNQTWVPLTENNSLITAYSCSAGIIINDWNPYIVPNDYAGLGDIMDVLLPFPPYSSGGWGSTGYAEAYNGSQTGDLGAIKTRYQFTRDGVLLYWRFYNGTGDGWHLVYSLDLQLSAIPGYDTGYIILGIFAGVVLYGIANEWRGRKLTLYR